MRYLFLILLFCVPSVAAAQKPVITTMSWGGAAYPNSLAPADKGNAGFDLTQKTSVDFGWTLGKGKLIPYFTAYTQRDTVGYVYNAKEKMTVGIAWERKIKKHAKLSFGVKYAYDYRSFTGDTFTGFGLTGDYSLYRAWAKEDGARVILSGWSNLRYPGSVAPSDQSNAIAQGRFTLAREKRLGESKFFGASFSAFGLFKDTDFNEFNNKVQLDFGVRLKRKIKKTDFTLSVKYRIDHRFKSGETYSGVIVGLNWFSKVVPTSGVKEDRNKAKGWLRRLRRSDT